MEKKKSLFPPVSKEIIEEISRAGSIAVMAHVNPDGDAIYSCLAMKGILSALGKDVYLLNDGPFKRREIAGIKDLFLQQVPESLKEKNPLLIILDCSTEDRPGNVYQSLKGNETIVIDHHSSGTPFYRKELSYIVPRSPSTTLLVDEIRIALSVKLTKEIAECLMIGFLTDTGFFHFINQDQAKDSFYKIASFAETGINPYELYDRLHDGKKLEDIKIAARIIAESKSLFGGKLILAYEKKEYETEERPGDAVYRSLLEAENVKAVVLVKEKDGAIEFGFRAKQNSNVDVGSLAASIGGGGHALASGATVKGLKIEDAEEFIIRLLMPLI